MVPLSFRCENMENITVPNYPFVRDNLEHDAVIRENFTRPKCFINYLIE